MNVQPVCAQHKRLMRYALRLAHGRTADAEDIYQQMLLRLLVTRTADARDPLAYAMTTMRSIVIEQCQRCAYQIARRSQPIDDAYDLIDNHMNVERLVDAQAIAERLDAKLAQLSPTRRRVWEMHECEGYTYEEIAAIVGCSTSMVKKHLHLVALLLAEPGRVPPARRAGQIGARALRRQR